MYIFREVRVTTIRLIMRATCLGGRGPYSTVLHACVYKSRNLLVETLYFHFVHTSLIKWNESINVLLISGLL